MPSQSDGSQAKPEETKQPQGQFGTDDLQQQASSSPQVAHCWSCGTVLMEVEFLAEANTNQPYQQQAVLSHHARLGEVG